MIITINTDGGCTKDGRTACSFIIKEDDLVVYTTSFSPSRCSTNNEAEYEALYSALSHVVSRYNKHDIENIQHFCDSLLLVNHFNGSFDIKKENLVQKMNAIKALCALSLDNKVTSTHVRREYNNDADWLCNIILDLF